MIFKWWFKIQKSKRIITVVVCRRSTFNNNRLCSRSISNWITVAYLILFQPDVCIMYVWIRIWISGTRYSRLKESTATSNVRSRSNIFGLMNCDVLFFFLTRTTHDDWTNCTMYNLLLLHTYAPNVDWWLPVISPVFHISRLFRFSFWFFFLFV